MATVTLEHVSKTYVSRGGPVTAVRDVNVTVGDGEFLVLVGPSGCGKSTTLRMIAGLESVTSGVIKIGDRVVNDVPARDRDIAMVFQNYALYPHMSVRQNLAFALSLRKIPKDAIDRRVRHAAELLGLEGLLDRQPRNLSGGQRQRVALGRAIVREPAVFLFDEPLSNLDAALRVQMRRDLAALRRRLGTTMIYVTHDQIEAMTLGDRIVVLKDGHVQQVDAPLALYRRPANTFVATFLGSPPMNLVHGALRDDGGAVFTADGSAFQLALGDAAPTPGDGTVILGIRPEDLRLGPAGAVGIAARVTEIEPLGNETLVSLDAGGVPLAARTDGATSLQHDDRVSVAAKPEHWHWFDGERGERIG